jgi:hypothetical protein
MINMNFKMLIVLVLLVVLVEVEAVQNTSRNAVQVQALYSLLDEVELEVLEVLVTVVEA